MRHSTATLIARLEELHYTPHLDTIERAAKSEIINKLDGTLEKLDRSKDSKNAVRKAQVAEVKRILQEAVENGIAQTLHQACAEAWTNLKGGYPSAKALYVYCNSHKEEFPRAK